MTFFTLRPATPADLPAAVALFNRASRAVTGRDDVTLEEQRTEWSDPILSLRDDTRVAVTPDGAMIGCVEVWNSAPFVQAWVLGRVEPSLRGQGIGTALMAWAEERVRARIAQAPPDARVVMRASALASDEPGVALLRGAGFQPVRHFWTMRRELDTPPPAPVWPAGIVVRGMQPGEEPAMLRADIDAFRDHYGFVERPFEDEFARWQHHVAGDPYFDPSLYFLAWDGDQIAGICLCAARTTDDPESGWVYSLGVRRPWRRRGLGMALLYHAFGELRARGCRRVGLGVDASSLTGATRLYERAGMHSFRERIHFEKELRPGTELATTALAAE
jgi:mycothiol synthase